MENLIWLQCSAFKVHFITFERFWLLEQLHLFRFLSFPFLGVIQIEFGKKFFFKVWKFSSVIGVLSFPPRGSSFFIEQSPMDRKYRGEDQELPSTEIHLICLEEYSNSVSSLLMYPQYSTWLFLVNPYPTNLSSYLGAVSRET